MGIFRQRLERRLQLRGSLGMLFDQSPRRADEAGGLQE